MKIKQQINRIVASSLSLLLVAFVLLVNTNAFVSASQVTSRSLTVSSAAPGNVSTDLAGNAVAPGAGGNGVKTKETFTFTLASTSNVGSILFEWCTTPIATTTCTSPTGLTTANVASIQSQTGFSSNNFNLDTSTVLTGSPYNCTGSSPGRTNCVAIKRASAASESSGATVTVSFGGQASDYITNPTGANTTFFVRMVTYSDTAYTTQVDYGTVASSTAQQVNITGKVQESLNFSVGTTVTAPGSSCTAFSDSGAIALGDVNGDLSTNQAYDAHSYFRISTNALHGATVLYSGDTLKFGSQQINSIGTTATASAVGTSQFGLGIDSSDTQGGSGYNFASLTSTSPYNQGNGTITNGGTARFAFDTTSVTAPVQVASSTTPISCDTGSVRYLSNIATTTASGIYTTTISYIAVPTY